MIQGRIVKGVGGSYLVRCEDRADYTCSAKGIFRYKKQKPLIGDLVRIEILDEEKKEANLVELLPRANELIRPAVANIDQAVIEFAVKDPDPNLNLLDRFLLLMEQQGLPVLICLNKIDLLKDTGAETFLEIYRKIGYPVYPVSAEQGTGIEALSVALQGKTTVWAGPSGVGKSSLINRLCPEISMETGEISEKIRRGKHTTRHTQLLRINESTYVCDTPGFSSISIEQIRSDALWMYFREFEQFVSGCRFSGCVHIGERDCGVKEAVRQGEIAASRYENYRLLYDGLKSRERY